MRVFKILEFIPQFLKHELVTGSFYVFIGTTLSSFLAFFLNLFFARSMSYADYGIFSSLFSLLVLFTIPSQSISAIVVRYATSFFAKKQEARIGAFYLKSLRYLVVFNILFNFVFLLLFPVLSNFLNIDRVGLFLLVGITISMVYLATLNLAFIQSLLQFKLLGFLYVVAGFGKLISGVMLVYLGFNVYGAIFATFIFSFIDFALGFIPLKEIIRNASKSVNLEIKDFTSFAVPAGIAVISLSSFISTDVILVKHYFSSNEAGLYGGLSLIGKVIFYFTGPIAIAMFPLIVKRHATDKKFNNLFYLSCLLVLTPSVLITFFYFALPDFTINIFLGGREYLSMAPYLGLFGILLTIFSLNNVFVNFFLSIKKTGVSAVVFLMAALQIIFINLFHKDFYQIIFVSISSSVLLLIFLIIFYLKTSKNLLYFLKFGQKLMWYTKAH